MSDIIPGKVITGGNNILFPSIDIDPDWDDDTKRFAESMNWQSEHIAKLHAMLLPIHDVFTQLAPMMQGMPGGLMTPGKGMPKMPKSPWS